jgi:hypothetical protein
MKWSLGEWKGPQRNRPPKTPRAWWKKPPPQGTSNIPADTLEALNHFECEAGLGFSSPNKDKGVVHG